MIVDTLAVFKEADVLQAFGRACRSQGQGKGTFFVLGVDNTG
jgi:hypothetical protein